jgi:hypothetical protein
VTIPANQFGYVLPEDRSYGVEKEHELIMQNVSSIMVSGAPIMGSGAGKIVLLHEVVTAVAGYYIYMVQSIGDCVAFGWGKGIMISLACDIIMRKESEQWPGAEIATEWLYGTSRVLVGKGRLGNGDGSVGSWMSKAVSPEGHGTLLRKKYGGHDLTKYSGQRAKSWGYRGLPLDLEVTADEHPVSTKPALVNSYEQARDSIANGYPVPVCSNQGFSDTRDSQGFARPSGRWGHCMCFIAVDDTGNRPGLLCDNSWPKGWISGPKRHNQPDGSFWVDADTADRMLKQNDSFAVPGFEGYAAANLDWSMF